jgi:hypothetical protein
MSSPMSFVHCRPHSPTFSHQGLLVLKCSRGKKAHTRYYWPTLYGILLSVMHNQSYSSVLQPIRPQEWVKTMELKALQGYLRGSLFHNAIVLSRVVVEVIDRVRACPALTINIKGGGTGQDRAARGFGRSRATRFSSV